MKEFAVSRHQPAALVDRAAARPRDDSLWNMTRIHDDEIGQRTDAETVVLEPQSPCGASRHEIKSDLKLAVDEETGPVADQHGAFEHVAIAIGPPGIANVVIAAEYRD